MISLRFAFFILSLIGLTTLIARRLADFGVFNKQENFNIESCRMITNFSQCEDIQVDYSNDLLYLSANNWTAFLQGNYSPVGGIYTFELKQKDAQPKFVSIDQPAVFHPHGFHLYADPQTGEKVLFVINHRKLGQSSVEIFDVINRDTLKHKETLTHELLINANKVLGVGKRSFYVTQDTKYSLNSLVLIFASIFNIEEGGLFYYDGNNWKTISEGLSLGNGLASSSDNKFLYVCETSKARVRIYEGDLKSGDIQYKTSHNLDVFPDNINMDSEGNLWAAGFSNLLATTQRLQGKEVNVPARIMKAKFDGDKLIDLRKMLTSTGEDILGITAVVSYEDKMIMSGTMSTEVWICDVPKDTPRSEIYTHTDL